MWKDKKKNGKIEGNTFPQLFSYEIYLFKDTYFLNLNINKGINLKQRNNVSERNKIYRPSITIRSLFQNTTTQ